MPSTFSTSLRLELQATGENRTTWGSKANQVFNMLEDAVSGVAVIDMANANYSMTTANGSFDQARNMIINISGGVAHTTTRTLTIPAVAKVYMIYNGTGGGFPITVSNGTNTVSVVNGKWYWLWTDGTTMNISPSLNDTYALLSQVIDLSGVTNQATARTNLGLGTISTQAASAVAITGGTIAGITDMAIADGGTGASTAGTARANLGLGTVALQDASSVAITGGTVSGITDLAVADGGTGASTAANARTNLGLAIGTNVQQADATLTSLAAVAGVAGDVLYANGTDTWTRLAKGTAGQVLTMNAGATAPLWSASFGAPDAVMEDQKAAGIDGGTFTSGAWQTRDLNTEAKDTFSYVSIAANQFTPTVTGWVEWSAPAYAVTGHKTRLLNVTDTTVAGVGSTETAASGPNAQSRSIGGCAVVAGKAYRLEHQSANTRSSTGFGIASDFSAIEVYTVIKFWRTS